MSVNGLPEISTGVEGAGPWGLARAYQALQEGEVQEGMRILFATLKRVRAELSPEAWKRFCWGPCRVHPIFRLIQADMATHWSFVRPRKYAGDAVLLDFFYQQLELPEMGASDLGIEVLRFLEKQRAVTALRGRRDLLAQWLDERAGQMTEARVLSVACGHLREAHLSRAVQEKRLGEFLALDQDPRSLAVVERELGPLGVKPVAGSVKALLTRQLAFEELDLIYAAGLYDYLPQPVAIRLTRLLVEMLKPGGRLLVANYADPFEDSSFKAYMEAFMDWWLIYRTEREVAEWLQELPSEQLRGHQLFRDETGNVIYLEITRR